MPTDWPRIQSASKFSTISMAALRSAPVPWISTRLRPVSTLTDPGLVAKLSTSLLSVWADTYCSGIAVIPKPGSGLPARSREPVPMASVAGTRR